MKRIAAFILLMLYFVTSTGGTMHYHYCMGELANSSFWGEKQKKCGKCGMEKSEKENNGCCKDEQQWVKIEDDQKGTAQFEIPKLQLAVISLVLFYYHSFAIQENTLIPESKALLRSCELPTYLLNGVFRI